MLLCPYPYLWMNELGMYKLRHYDMIFDDIVRVDETKVY